MPDYDFRNLSPVDFEHLARDALNADLGLALQSYASGRDQGIDLRQVTADGSVIVGQCKHYLESSWSTFQSAVRKEAVKARALNADRYMFVTSRPLSPGNQGKIYEELSDLRIAHDDVWGRDELNAALGRHPDVERTHLKLWLSSTVMLDSLLNAGRWQRGDATLDDARDRAKFWVHNSVYDQVVNILEREGVCIVSGPPGVGKTFVAEMVLLSAVTRDGWEPVHVSDNIEEAWKALKNDGSRQFFYFNDFLGETELDVASRNEPTKLASFIARITMLGKHKRFLMTTREQILGQAATSEYDSLRQLASKINRIGVRMGAYSTRARAEILFNHIYFSGISELDRARLAVDNRIVSIVDHPAYNPRLIRFRIEDAFPQTAEEILDVLIQALDHPDEVWDTSFRRLSPTGQQILLSLATLPSRPWPLETVRYLTGATGALDWRPTLRVLEPTWVRITGKPSERHAVLANPSCRDYLLGLLDDSAVAEEQVHRIRLIDQIMSLSRSAGLLPGTTTAAQRPELAHALASRRDYLTEIIRSYVDTENRPVRKQVKVLADVATLVSQFGRESDTDWLLDRIALVIEMKAPGLEPHSSDLLLLAEHLTALRTGAHERLSVLAEHLVVTGVSMAETTRDLDNYETLPEEIRSAATQDAALQAASKVIAAELDSLARTVDSPEVLRALTSELEQRAHWYGFDIDVGPLLDKADDLEATELEEFPRPEAGDWPRDSDDEVADTTISDLFSRLAD